MTFVIRKEFRVVRKFAGYAFVRACVGKNLSRRDDLNLIGLCVRRERHFGRRTSNRKRSGLYRR